LPIHPNNKILKETLDYIIICIEVTLSYELYEYILSKTPNVKVVSPQKVVKEITSRIAKAKKLYK
jgi:hypothetical protein